MKVIRNYLYNAGYQILLMIAMSMLHSNPNTISMAPMAVRRIVVRVSEAGERRIIWPARDPNHTVTAKLIH